MLEDIKILLLSDFEMCDDPVRTEEEIYNQIKERTVLTDYVYVVFPIAHCLNKFGRSYTQGVIDRAHQETMGYDVFFVCQHIKVTELNFHGHRVFTPHATKMDGHDAIPHYSANVVERGETKPFSERKYQMSFQGSFATHWTRQRLQQFNGGLNLIQDSGQWNFQKNKEKRNKSEKDYVELLNDTKIALCPRGTGPSTIRLWEAMGSGCVPLVISDYLKMPLSNIIEWDDLILTVPENDIGNLMDYVPSDDVLEEMAKECQEKYYEFFENSCLYKTIVSSI